MQLIKTNKFYFILFILTIAPLYYRPNIGGIGLSLTFNMSIWLAASAFICLSVLLITRKKLIRLPDSYLPFVAVPVVIFIYGAITGTPLPAALIFREIFILGGLLFFFALFQFDIKRGQIDWVLLAIALSTLVHSSIGIIQIYHSEILGGWFATQEDNLPRGIFQQINAQASFLATGIAISIYLLSRPIAKNLGLIASILLMLSLFSSSLVIAYSGSRTGALSLLLLVPLLLIGRKKQLLSNKQLVVVALVAIVCGGVIGKGGFERTLNKTTSIAQGVSGSARINIYKIAFELVSQKPFQGHGIGSLLKVWNLQSSDYYSRYPHANLASNLEHPHNELIFLLIEGGLIIISGVLAAIIAVLLALIRCGWQRSSGYCAMLLPITLHSQVELPFYTSSLHWFLWLFLIFVVMRHKTFVCKINVGFTANRLIQASTILIFIGILYFLQHSSKAVTDIYIYTNRLPSDSPYLQTALNNYYFKYEAEELARRASLHNAMASNDSKQIKSFITWAENRIEVSPKLQLFEDLYIANVHLDDQKSKCKIIDQALQLYPQVVRLQNLKPSCSH